MRRIQFRRIDGNLTLRSRESYSTETEDSGFDLASASPSVDGFTYNDFGEMTKATVNGITSTYYREKNIDYEFAHITENSIMEEVDELQRPYY